MKQQELLIKNVLDTWHSSISRTDNFLSSLTDEQLQNEVAPGRNRGTYLLGHLTAVHDRMLPLLGIGQPLYPHLDNPFIAQPDKAVADLPSVTDLRNYWKEVNTTLAKHFANLTPDEWFQKHTSVSDEDFAKEPHRNRLNIIISRSNHLSYHLGQLAFLKNKEK